MKRKAASKPVAGAPIRCAIYTRKSTEEGLDQEFNSLDAQREACAAYITSQRHEGWVLALGHYDDGGFSGGNMERPGMKRLMAEVEAGRVDVIVVYKVDRLTRSLADFAKIVEVLDARGASFVSITQAFNTTTSMGRLTLNVLLSFAQFEREVTGERIRDKIAASKRKGLWMGGPVPLGYEVSERKLVVNETEAELVRHIMQRYLALGSVNELIDELARDGRRTKLQVRASGPHKGGCPFRRGTLYHLLANRIYLGEIVHKGVAHPGEHLAIVPQDLWEAVQEKLATRGPGLIVKREGGRRSRLLGLLYDGLGREMTANHARKSSTIYRYYVTREALPEQPAWRVAAHDLERIVSDQLRALFRDRNRIARLVASVDPRQLDRVVQSASRLAAAAIILEGAVRSAVQRIELHEDRIDVRVSEAELLRVCGVETGEQRAGEFTISAPVERVRRGHELRLIIPGDDQASASTTRADEKLVALLGEAMDARALVLATPDRSINEIAAEHGRCRKRLMKLVRLSWLSPELVRSIAAGEQPVPCTAQILLDAQLPLCWSEHRAALV